MDRRMDGEGLQRDGRLDAMGLEGKSQRNGKTNATERNKASALAGNRVQ